VFINLRNRVKIIENKNEKYPAFSEIKVLDWDLRLFQMSVAGKKQG